MTQHPEHRGTIRTVIADDHAPTREDVRFALAADERFEVVAEAADAAGAIDAAVRLRPDLCLLDVNMPGSGLAAVWEIRARLPQCTIVMLTVSQEDTSLIGALQAGASGYLLKGMDPRALPRALAAAVEGEVTIPRAMVGQLVEGLRDRSPRRRATLPESGRERLTSREWQVLELLRQGLTTAQMARRLVLSPVTVRTHVQAILRKYEVATREELLERLDAER